MAERGRGFGNDLTPYRAFDLAPSAGLSCPRSPCPQPGPPQVAWIHDGNCAGRLDPPDPGSFCTTQRHTEHPHSASYGGTRSHLEGVTGDSFMPRVKGHMCTSLSRDLQFICTQKKRLKSMIWKVEVVCFRKFLVVSALGRGV